MPFSAVATSTAAGAAIMCLAMASGMGINAVLAFSVIGFHRSNVPWQAGMAVIFAQGVLILVLVLTGFREAVMNARFQTANIIAFYLQADLLCRRISWLYESATVSFNPLPPELL